MSELPDWVAQEPPELDAAGAIAERNAAMAAVEAAAEQEAKDAIMCAIAQVAYNHAGGGTFLVDLVWELLPGRPREARVIGPLLREAKRLGWIRSTGGLESSSQRQCHGNKRTLWQSCF